MMSLQACVTAVMPWKKSASGTGGIDSRSAERIIRLQLASGRKRLGRLCPTR
ncbi:MAG TPA: hypothetical protein VFA39_20315 [Steroidobacteraceae bacterium]|nr:hypothetical protein [Steroidobacteraceae bacterium]